MPKTLSKLLISLVIFTFFISLVTSLNLVWAGDENSTTNSPNNNPQQQLANAMSEKANLELNIKDLEKALNSDYAKNNPLIRDTLNDNLKNAKQRLSEVKGQITDLNKNIQESLSQTPQAQVTQPTTIQPQVEPHIATPFQGGFDYGGSCRDSGNRLSNPFGGGVTVKDSVNWNGLGLPRNPIVNTWQDQDNWNFVVSKHKQNVGPNWTYNQSPNAFLPSPSFDKKQIDWSAIPVGNNTPSNPQTQSNQPQTTTPQTQANQLWGKFNSNYTPPPIHDTKSHFDKALPFNTPTANTQTDKSQATTTNNAQIPIAQSKQELEDHLKQSQDQLEKLKKKFGSDNPGTAEARKILEGEINDTKSKLEKLNQLPSDKFLILDVPHNEFLDLKTPYTGNSVVNTSEVPVEVFATRPDGSRWTIVLEPRQVVNLENMGQATHVELRPLKEGKVSGKVERADGTTLVDINTPGSHVIPQTQTQTTTPGVQSNQPQTTTPPTQVNQPQQPTQTKQELEDHLKQSQDQLEKLKKKFGPNNPGTAEARRILEGEIKDTQTKINQLPPTELQPSTPNPGPNSHFYNSNQTPPVNTTTITATYTPDLPVIDTNLINPRVGSSYQLGDKALVRANYALFADQLGKGSTTSGLNPFYTYLQGGLDNQPPPVPNQGKFSYANWAEHFTEGTGEQLGIGGPIIANGLFNKEPGVMYFDNFGVPLAGITQQQAKQFPSLAGDLIGAADDKSVKNYQQEFLGGIEFEVARSVSLGVRYIHRSIPQVLEDVGGNTPNPNNFTPQAFIVPQLGMMPGDAQTFGGLINNQLANNVKGSAFWGPVSCCGTVYIDEPIFGRSVLEDVPAVVPNDPLYFKSSKKTEPVKKKASQTLTLIGSAMKMGGVTLGTGEGSQQSRSPMVNDQWGIQKVGFLPKSNPDSAWNVIDGQEKNVLVAIIDSGLDMAHPDGPQYIWTNPKEIPDNGKDDDNDGYVDDVHGWNFIDNSNDLTDNKGHGTFVAGIIAAKTNNGIGVAGINPGAEIMMLKVADRFGQTNNLNIARAIYFAVNHGAKIINISLGAKGISKLEQLAINYAFRKGVLVVIAGGNDGDYTEDFGPGFLKRTLTVGAVDYEGPVSIITNWGPNLSLLAPGEEIYSLYSKDSDWAGPAADKERLYYKGSGTSFATPMVSATASLLLAKNPQLTNRQIMDILLDTATDMDKEGWDAKSGAGLLNASKALRVADPKNIFTVEISEIIVNRENNQAQSVDVFGVVRGNVGSYTVELGKGKNPTKWDEMAGPFKRRAEYTWLCRLDQKVFQGNRDWSVRIKAVGKDGKVKTAQSVIPFNVNVNKK